MTGGLTDKAIGFLARWAYRLPRPPLSLAELECEARTAAWLAARTWDGRSSRLSSWQWRCVRNRLLDITARRRRHRPPVVLPWRCTPSHEERVLRKVALERILPRLTAAQARAVRLVLAGWTPAEIARRVGMSDSAVCGNLRRAAARARRYL